MQKKLIQLKNRMVPLWLINASEETGQSIHVETIIKKTINRINGINVFHLSPNNWKLLLFKTAHSSTLQKYNSKKIKNDLQTFYPSFYFSKSFFKNPNKGRKRTLKAQIAFCPKILNNSAIPINIL